jgi:hypothetical protein
MFDEYGLVRLDRQTVRVQRLAQRAVRHRLGEGRPLAVGPLDRLVRDRYHGDFAAQAWHGSNSHARIVWQDRDVLAALADPVAVRTVLAPVTATSGIAAGVGSLLLRGIATTRPSYLLTAAPNWRCRPPLPPPAWHQLSDMAAPPDSRPPMLVTAGYLERGLTAIHGFGSALAEAPCMNNWSTTMPKILAIPSCRPPLTTRQFPRLCTQLLRSWTSPVPAASCVAWRALVRSSTG